MTQTTTTVEVDATDEMSTPSSVHNLTTQVNESKDFN